MDSVNVKLNIKLPLSSLHSKPLFDFFKNVIDSFLIFIFLKKKIFPYSLFYT